MRHPRCSSKANERYHKAFPILPSMRCNLGGVFLAALQVGMTLAIVCNAYR